MDKRLNDLLIKIGYDKELFNYFVDVKISKIVVKEEKNIWNIYLDSKSNIPYFVIDKFIRSLNLYVKNKYTYNIFVNVSDIDYELVNDYYENILVLCNSSNMYHDMFLDRLVRVEDDYFIEVYNKNEESLISKKLGKINELFKQYGFDIEIKLRINEEANKEIIETINKDLEIPSSIDLNKKEEVREEKGFKKYSSKLKEKDPNALFGSLGRRNVDLNQITKLKDITYEMDNVTVLVTVFGVVLPTKKGVNSLSLKVTDKTTSMYVRMFFNTEEEFESMAKTVKDGMNLKINGYVKNNTYYNDLIINARYIEEVKVEEKAILDEEEEKRVELHTHTLMSQMDGVVSVKDLIKRAIKWGHKAIAITDHNAIQTFPEAFHHKDEIKILYGVELAMVDDTIDLTFRADDSKLLDNTYVVFDLETTGFNAGGSDKIIEIGAVKLKDGRIIDRFDEFVNPGFPISQKITDITSITDDMVKDSDDEETVVKRFMDWVGSLPMVAHNAKFDQSFIEICHQKYDMGEFKNPVLDTLQISRVLDPDNARHSLSVLVKRYEIPWDEDKHHRADYDAEATALIFDKMLKRLSDKKIIKTSDVNTLVAKDEIHKIGEMFHITILVKNQIGLKNLFKIVSLANTKYLYKTPRILKSEIEKLREGLLIGSACANGEVFSKARSKSDDELREIMSFYDYIEVQPPEVYSYLVDLTDFKNNAEVEENIKKIISVADSIEKIVVATGDVHHLNREDKIYREIIVNQKVPGGGRHPLNRKEIIEIPSQHFRTTREMLDDFSFLDEDVRKKIVITNTNLIADSLDEIEIIPDTKGIPFSPKFPNSEQEIKDRVYNRAHEIYGDPLPEIIENRIESELKGILHGGFDTIYLIAQRLVKHSNDDGYVVGSRGSVGSSFVATMLNVSEVNPLPAHYICPNCKKSIFNDEDGNPYGINYASGFDLPDRVCECGTKFRKDGQDMPFATFLGFNADKVPDIDLNFSGDYQPRAHEYTKVLFGEDNVYRAGTIGTVAEKTAYGFVKGYFEDKEITGIRSLEIERLAQGVTGVKRSTGQHPGGIVVVPDYKDIYDFTPFQYPADDTTAAWRTTHFNYHDIESCLLKLDILGHDNPTIFKMLEELTGIKPEEIPMDDKEVMSLFSSPKALGVTEEEIECSVGCLALPEFTKFVMGIVEETHPTTFAELVKISGLSHGTDVWNGNAQDIVRDKIVPFKEVIGCRDDIMVYLMNHGMEPLLSFKIMEFVRKGKASKDPATWLDYKKKLEEGNIPSWFIESCGKIKYMFPKAHATAYITAAWRIGWFKINRAIEYYATFFSIKCFSFDLDVMEAGYKKIKEKLDELKENRYSLSVKDQDLITTLEVALEMTARGYKFTGIDLNKSDARYFVIDDDKKTLIPPFRAIDGLGDTVANQIISEREKCEFLSIEDFQKRGKVSSTTVEKMRMMGIFRGIPESSQISLFDNL